MDLRKFFGVLVDEIHSVVVATVSKDGLPTTRVIDLMLEDEYGLYFLTAKGKAFYQMLLDQKYVSLSGMVGSGGTLTKKAISVSGAVRSIGSSRLDEIFEKNPYMKTIYSSSESRKALEVFCIYKGQGEYFDLSSNPISRQSFTFGGTKQRLFGYRITDDCFACGDCTDRCPSSCISPGDPYVINQAHCLHCGNCFEVCAYDAVEKLDAVD